jgi:hypothetical protein
MKTILKLQKEMGYHELQQLINSGIAWKLEGSIGRAAMDALRSGACMLPNSVHYDYYGNRIPSVDEVEKGTTGSIENMKKFYAKFR